MEVVEQVTHVPLLAESVGQLNGRLHRLHKDRGFPVHCKPSKDIGNEMIYTCNRGCEESWLPALLFPQACLVASCRS